MKWPPSVQASAARLAAGVFVLLPLALSAQQTPPSPTQPSDWRQANDAVGAYPRGHADVLKWERAHPAPQQAPEAAVPGTAVPTLDDAVRRAWLPHPELARVQSRLGPQNVQAIASGRWEALDPSLQRRVDDMGELLEVAAQARKAWLEAVAARQTVRHQQTRLEAAQAASELGQRMVAVGNWSRLQQSPWLLAEASARMDLRRASFAAAQAQTRLIDLLGLSGVDTALALPDRLPDVPATAVPGAELQQRASAIQAQLPAAEQRRNKALAPTAIAAYQTAHALALDSRDVVLKERTFITEETVLHYNGMLKSVWDLLDETRNQAQATADAIAAQRDFWIAQTDLQWVLLGGTPDRFVSLAGGEQAPTAAAH